MMPTLAGVLPSLRPIRLAPVAGATWLLAAAQALAADPTPEAAAAADTIPVDVPAADRTVEATPAGDAPLVLDEIVVTGEKLGRDLAQTASSVGIATRRDLEASSAGSMKDVVTQFANVISASGDREISIRGVPQTGIGGEGETISVYLDGVALPAQAARFAGPLSAWDLEQVEVLRGAQSTNQGRNSLAGSVVLRSVEPTSTWDLRARAGVMSRDGHDFAIAGGGLIVDGLAFRVAGQDRYDNGDIENTTRHEDDAGRESTRNWRAKLAWTPSFLPGYRAQYGFTHADNEFGDPLHDASGGRRTETSNVRGNEDDTTKLHSLEQFLAIGDAWQLDAITGYAEIGNLYTIDFDRSATDGGYSDNTVNQRDISQELRLRYTAGAVRAVFGAYYEDGDDDAATYGHDVATAGGAALLNGFVVSNARTKTAALFTEADWDVLEHWRLTAGLRLNQERSRRHDTSDLDITLTAPLPGLPANVPIGVPLPDATSEALAMLLPDTVPPDYDDRDRRKFTDLLPKLGVTWLASETTTVSLTWQEGYRSGGTSISFFGGGVSPYDPEYTSTVEAALRWRGFDRHLTFNVNAFHTWWRDQQVTIGETSGFSTTTENAGRSHYYGLETEALWRFDRPFDLFASVGVLRSRFDRFVNDGEDYKGNRFPYAPRQTAVLGLTLREWARVSGQLQMNMIGAIYGDADNDPRSRSDARVLVNAKLGYRLGAGFTLAVYGRNLTDDANEQGVLVAGDREATRYGEPRSFGAVVEWQL